MFEKLRSGWKALNCEIVINKRELILGVTTCTLAGILTGILLSPKKSVTIGSHNGNNNTGNAASLSAGEEDEAAAEDGE